MTHEELKSKIFKEMPEVKQAYDALESGDAIVVKRIPTGEATIIFSDGTSVLSDEGKRLLGI